MIVAGLVVCEVAFWVFLVLGLTARYVLGRPRLSKWLLLGSPLADVGLLVLTGFDLAHGATATQAHALAALYVGFTVAFGERLVAAADHRFVQRFRPDEAAMLNPVTPAGLRPLWLGWAVSVGLLSILSLIAADFSRAAALLGAAGLLTAGVIVWSVVQLVRRPLGRVTQPETGRA